MAVMLIIMGVSGPLLLLLGLLSFIGARHKLASYELALAQVTGAYSREEQASDGDTVTRYYNKLLICNRSGQELSTITMSGKRKLEEQYLLLYNPATGPKEENNILRLSLAAIWFGPLCLLFLGALLLSLSLLLYFFA